MKPNRPSRGAKVDSTDSGAVNHVQAMTGMRLIRQALAEFRGLTGLAVLLVPVPTPVRAVGFRRQENEFCFRLNRAHEAGCVDCRRAQQELFRRLSLKLRPQTVCCAGGLVQFAVPVIAGGEHVATVLGGKVFKRAAGGADFQTATARLRLRGTGKELESLRAAYLRSPVLSPAKLRAALRMLDVLARLFGEALTCRSTAFPVPDPPRLAQVKAYLAQHVGERLTTAQVAKTLNLSNAYFCRLFRRMTGLTFHAYLAQVRVEAAKQQLQNTFTPITEICYGTGFQSVSDFNRVFKTWVGCSPSQYRREARRQTLDTEVRRSRSRDSAAETGNRTALASS